MKGFIAVLALIIPWCGDDGTGPDETPMSRAEASAFAEGLYGGSLLVVLPSGEDDFAIEQSGGAFTREIECTGGGTATFAGRSTVANTGSSEIIAFGMNGDMEFAGCTFSGGGSVWEVNDGPLDITGIVSMHSPMGDGDLTISLDFTSYGPISWSSGEKEGNCQLDNRITVSFDFASAFSAPPVATVAGAVCGVNIQHQVMLR